MSKPHNGVNEFVVTAAGKKELFPVVDEMISLAPKLDAWEFTALKSASGLGFHTQYGDVTLKADERWFFP